MAFADEEPVSIGEDVLILAIDFRQIALIEHLCGEVGAIKPMPEVLALLFADPPPRGTLGKVLWALLRRHHKDISLDASVGLLFGEHCGRLAQAIRSLIVRAMNFAEPKAKDKNPPLRRGAFAIS